MSEGNGQNMTNIVRSPNKNKDKVYINLKRDNRNHSNSHSCKLIVQCRDKNIQLKIRVFREKYGFPECCLSTPIALQQLITYHLLYIGLRIQLMQT